MKIINSNLTLMATALLVNGIVVLGLPMAEGLHQEKLGSLRRQLDQDPPSPAAVNLLTAGKFAILSKTGVTTTGTTSVTGDMGTSPITSTAWTGFGLISDPATKEFSTSTLVTGNVYAPDYLSPTPNLLTVAILDMQSAYLDAALRPITNPNNIDLEKGNIEGLVLAHGVYKWGTNVKFTSSVTFNGSATDIWILQIAGDVSVASGAKVKLAGGAKAENIFWQIGGKAILGTTSHVEGVFLCSTSIVFMTGSSMNGAALAQTAVTLGTTTIEKKSVCDPDVGCVES